MEGAEMKPSLVSFRREPYLCGHCADKAGAKWPKGHVATAHTNTCPYCQVPALSLTHWTDWNWPDRITDRSAKVNREV